MVAARTNENKEDWSKRKVHRKTALGLSQDHDQPRAARSNRTYPRSATNRQERSQKQQGAASSNQEQTVHERSVKVRISLVMAFHERSIKVKGSLVIPKLPGAARSSQKQPGAARSNHEQL